MNESTDTTIPKPPEGKKRLASSPIRLCACGNPAVKVRADGGVCARCLELENRRAFCSRTTSGRRE